MSNHEFKPIHKKSKSSQEKLTKCQKCGKPSTVGVKHLVQSRFTKGLHQDYHYLRFRHRDKRYSQGYKSCFVRVL